MRIKNEKKVLSAAGGVLPKPVRRPLSTSAAKASFETLEKRRVFSAALSSLSTRFSADDLIADAHGDLFGTLHGKVFEVQAGSHKVVTLVKGGVTSKVALNTAGDVYVANRSAIFRIAAGTHDISVVASVEVSQGVPSDLLIDSAGNIYGTIGDDKHAGIFEVPAGTHTLSLLTTGLASDDLVVDSAGNLDLFQNGNSVFQITAGTHAVRELTSTLAILEASPGNLVADSIGNIFGADSFGQIFEVQPGNDFRHAYGVVALAPNGGGSNVGGLGHQVGGLAMDAVGNIFGVSNAAGRYGYGEIFEVHAGSHAVSSVAVFNGKLGSFPQTILAADRTGTLYVSTLNRDPSTGKVPNPKIAKGSIIAITGTGFVPSADSAPSLLESPTAVATTVARTVNFVANAGGYPQPTVRWQFSGDGGKSFGDIVRNDSATSTTLTVSGVTSGQNGTQYRAVFTNSLGSVVTRAATLRLVPPLTLSVPAHADIPTATGFSTTLKALAIDPLHEQRLSYTWSVVHGPSGAKPVAFSNSGKFAAKKSVATFYKSGGYTLRCTIADRLGRSLFSDVFVNVILP